jgi:hypothetical protein
MIPSMVKSNSNGLCRYCIIPCGSSKKITNDELIMAFELYEGPYYSACLNWAQSVIEDQNRLRILSAKHGFVPLDARIATYDIRFGMAGAVGLDALKAQADSDKSLIPFRDPLNDVIILGGVDYVMMARQALGTGRGLGSLMKREMGGRPAGIGWQLSWFKRNRGLWPR